MKKTSNTQRQTSNVERVPLPLVVQELPSGAYKSGKRRQFDLEDRLLEFAVDIIAVTDDLPNTRAANHIAGQLLRSGTSPYGNHGEVESAESRKDFVHKLKECLKELKETRRWLRLAAKSAIVSASKMTAILSETEELIKIFFSSIRTA